MFKAAAKTDQGDLIIIGLSHTNLDRLREGNPLLPIDLSEFGFPNGKLFIFAGETEAAMAQGMAELIGPQTQVHGMPRR